MSQPNSPLIYHITHVDNLPGIIASGGLYSDKSMRVQSGPAAAIGMSQIKTSRLSTPVSIHPGLYVGDCVPFYFCPRSVMLYVIHCANHPDLTYKGGQQPILHLESDLSAVVAWANSENKRWAFSLGNAAARYTAFRKDLAQLGEINWSAVAKTDFRDSVVKEGKQAEFLVEDFLPFDLIKTIGVSSQSVTPKVYRAVSGQRHIPAINIKPDWYY